MPSITRALIKLTDAVEGNNNERVWRNDGKTETGKNIPEKTAHPKRIKLLKNDAFLYMRIKPQITKDNPKKGITEIDKINTASNIWKKLILSLSKIYANTKSMLTLIKLWK